MSELFGKELYGKVCDHGSLQRSCNICDLESQLSAAKAEIDGMKGHIDKEHGLWTGSVENLYATMRYYESEPKRLLLDLHAAQSRSEELRVMCIDRSTENKRLIIEKKDLQNAININVETISILSDREKRLRAALEEIKNHLYDKQDMTRCRDIASTALDGGKA